MTQAGARPGAKRKIYGSVAGASEAREKVAKRWHDLREMLIRQLDMFENGDLILRSSNSDVSASAIADLKASILEFDALISAEASSVMGDDP